MHSPSNIESKHHIATLLPCSVERLELVSRNWRLVFMQVRQWVLCPVVMCIIVRIDRLRFKTGNRVKLLDSRCAKASQCTEHRTFDLRNFGILNRVHQCVLGLCGVVLEFLRGVLLTEWSNLVEVHLKVVRHLFGKLILWSLCCTGDGNQGEGETSKKRHCEREGLFFVEASPESTKCS